MGLVCNILKLCINYIGTAIAVSKEIYVFKKIAFGFFEDSACLKKDKEGKMRKKSLCGAVAASVFIVFGMSHVAEAENCMDCHKEQNPGLYTSGSILPTAATTWGV